MNTKRACMLLIAATLCFSLGCGRLHILLNGNSPGTNEVKLVVAESGYVTLNAQPDQLVTWTTPKGSTFLFQVQFLHATPCINFPQQSIIPQKPSNYVQCKVDPADAEMNIQYQVVIQPGGPYPSQVTDCRPCSLNSGSGLNQTPTSPTTVPYANQVSRAPVQHASRDGSSDISFTCANSTPVLDDPEPDNLIQKQDPQIVVWAPDHLGTAWKIHFNENPGPCKEGQDLDSTVQARQKCTIDSGAQPRQYHYTVTASGNACGNYNQPSAQGQINLIPAP